MLKLWGHTGVTISSMGRPIFQALRTYLVGIEKLPSSTTPVESIDPTLKLLGGNGVDAAVLAADAGKPADEDEEAGGEPTCAAEAVGVDAAAEALVPDVGGVCQQAICRAGSRLG